MQKQLTESSLEDEIKLSTMLIESSMIESLAEVSEYFIGGKATSPKDLEQYSRYTWSKACDKMVHYSDHIVKVMQEYASAGVINQQRVDTAKADHERFVRQLREKFPSNIN